MEKAAVIDTYARQVRTLLAERIADDELWSEVLTVARGRHVLGSYEYGDANLFEWSDGKVRAAILEEIADAIVYQSWLRRRELTDESGYVIDAERG